MKQYFSISLLIVGNLIVWLAVANLAGIRIEFDAGAEDGRYSLLNERLDGLQKALVKASEVLDDVKNKQFYGFLAVDGKLKDFPQMMQVLVAETVRTSLASKADHPSGSVRNERYQKSAIFHENQRNERHTILSLIPDGHNDPVLYNALAREVDCPNMVRLGGVADGGKWVCNPWSLPHNCTIFSLGVNNQISFEFELQSITDKRCRIIGVDQAGQSNSTIAKYEELNGKLFAAKIGPATNLTENGITLEDLMRFAGTTRVEMLKMDIEGGEHEVLEKFLAKNVVCQIFVEIHGSVREMSILLRAVAKHGYLLYNYEINAVSFTLCEFALIHKSCLQKYDAVLLAAYLHIPQTPST